jgi:hypothetical protein
VTEEQQLKLLYEASLLSPYSEFESALKITNDSYLVKCFSPPRMYVWLHYYVKNTTLAEFGTLMKEGQFRAYLEAHDKFSQGQNQEALSILFNEKKIYASQFPKITNCLADLARRNSNSEFSTGLTRGFFS